MRGGIWLVRYTYSYIARAMRALQSSSKTSLRIDDEGLLSMQFMMPGPRRQGRERSQAFIEFWVSARLQPPSFQRKELTSYKVPTSRRVMIFCCCRIICSCSRLHHVSIADLQTFLLHTLNASSVRKHSLWPN